MLVAFSLGLAASLSAGAGIECGCPEGSPTLPDNKQDICKAVSSSGEVTCTATRLTDNLCPTGFDPCDTAIPTTAPTTAAKTTTAPLTDAARACGCPEGSGALSENKHEICIFETELGTVDTCEPVLPASGRCRVGFEQCATASPTSAPTDTENPTGAPTTAALCSELDQDDFACGAMFTSFGVSRCTRALACPMPWDKTSGEKLCTKCPQSCGPVGCCDGLPDECADSVPETTQSPNTTDDGLSPAVIGGIAGGGVVVIGVGVWFVSQRSGISSVNLL